MDGWILFALWFIVALGFWIMFYKIIVKILDMILEYIRTRF